MTDDKDYWCSKCLNSVDTCKCKQTDRERLVEIMEKALEMPISNGDQRTTAEELADAIIAAGFGDVAWVTQQLERAKTYRGIEGYACPLCKYEKGKFIHSCEMHRQISEKDKRIAELEKQVNKIKSVLSSKDIPQEYAKLINEHFWEIVSGADDGR